MVLFLILPLSLTFVRNQHGIQLLKSLRNHETKAPKGKKREREILTYIESTLRFLLRFKL